MGMGEIIFLVVIISLAILIPIVGVILRDIDYKKQLSGKTCREFDKDSFVEFEQNKNPEMESIKNDAELHRKQDVLGPL